MSGGGLPFPTGLVDSNVDAPDANPGDGKCATAPLQLTLLRRCTLRAALMESNVLGGGVNVITVPAGVTLSGGGITGSPPVYSSTSPSGTVGVNLSTGMDTAVITVKNTVGAIKLPLQNQSSASRPSEAKSNITAPTLP